jgi:hypothetical protein
MSDRDPASVENGSSTPRPAQPAPAAPTTQPLRRERGCVGRIFAALLVVIITSIIALMTVASGLLYLGFTPDMPARLGGAQAQVGTLEAQNLAFQTQVAAQRQLSGDDHEVLSEVEQQLAGLDQLQSQLREEREAALSQNATLVAEARASRDSVTVFATAEASRAALLQQLEQRSARVERFLQRLSDIAGDASLDLGAATTPLAEPVPSAAATTISELSPTPSASPVPTGTPTVIAEATPTRTPSPTATLGR